MLTAQTRATPDPDVIRTQLKNGDIVLLHMGSQTYFTLNPTGAQIWDLLEKGLDLGAVSRALTDRYAVDAQHAQQSVESLVDELAKAQLVALEE